MMRMNEPGWVELARPDGRRGVWIRVTDRGIELCAGREGDDEYLSLEKGKLVSDEDIYHAQEIVCSFEWARELGEEQNHRFWEMEGRLFRSSTRIEAWNGKDWEQHSFTWGDCIRSRTLTLNEALELRAQISEKK